MNTCELEQGEAYTKPYDFMRCCGCRSLLTRPVIDKNMGEGRYCDCGSGRANPGWPSRLDWFRPSVIWFAILRTLGKA